jgi:tape measure domain-containing protein
MATETAVTTAFKAKDKAMIGSLKRMDKAVNKFGKSADRAFKKASQSGSRFGDVVKGILAAGAIQKGLGLLKRGMASFITEASKIEDAVAAFTPLLGSAKKAEQAVDAINKTAATTPFQFENISDAVNQLLPVMDGNVENTIKTFRLLGDTAGGNAQKLQSITRGFTKAMLKGKVDMESLNMIAEAGVPIFDQMSKSMGVSKEQLFEMSKRGKLTTDALTKTFQAMTSEGGIFFKGMEIASKTFSGKLSTLKDNISLTVAEIGKSMLPTIKELTDKAIIVAQKIRAWTIENKELIKEKVAAFINGIKTAIAIMTPILSTVFSIFKALIPVLSAMSPVIIALVAGMVAYNSVLKVQAAFQAVQMFMGMAKALRGASIAQTLLNVAMMANPIGLIIAGVVALIALFVVLQKKFDIIGKTKAFFGFGETEEKAKGEKARPTPEAPNAEQARARAQNINFQGQLNIAGAPPGSTVESKTKGASPVNMQLLGANP